MLPATISQDWKEGKLSAFRDIVKAPNTPHTYLRAPRDYPAIDAISILQAPYRGFRVVLHQDTIAHRHPVSPNGLVKTLEALELEAKDCLLLFWVPEDRKDSWKSQQHYPEATEAQQRILEGLQQAVAFVPLDLAAAAGSEAAGLESASKKPRLAGEQRRCCTCSTGNCSKCTCKSKGPCFNCMPSSAGNCVNTRSAAAAGPAGGSGGAGAGSRKRKRGT